MACSNGHLEYNGFIVPSLLNSVAYVYESLTDLLSKDKAVSISSTRISCMTTNMYISLYTFGETASPLVLLLLSLDRCLAMLSPKAYARLTPRAAAVCIFLVYTCSLIEVTALWIKSRWNDHISLVSSRCSHIETIGLSSYRVHVIGIIVSGIVSIIFSVTSLAVMRWRIKSTRNEILRFVQMRREPTITRRIAVLVTAAFLLQVLPMTVFLIHLDGSMLAGIENFIWLPYISSLIFNTMWCAFRQKELKLAIKRMLKIPIDHLCFCLSKVA
ncbi:unnamed protein product [Soboliphyme baturini]|uniref:G_PROTEIN_RECEP_F1_2 domain-containing protein n=1 Tax=Soboliphyme baturini TaxID=241478 RepID=A0A183IHP5_9BILA|nr:unnamed protein product [Soboliphyme baturini]